MDYLWPTVAFHFKRNRSFNAYKQLNGNVNNKIHCEFDQMNSIKFNILKDLFFEPMVDGGDCVAPLTIAHIIHKNAPKWFDCHLIEYTGFHNIWYIR